MPDGDKQKKKEDIEKLRMVLDNPRESRAVSSDSSYLDSVRRRLTRSGSSKHIMKMSQSSSSQPDFLKPQVTIHECEEKISPITSRTEFLKEPVVKQRDHVVEKRFVEHVIVDPEDLYEIERVKVFETTVPEWEPITGPEDKVIPEWIVVETVTPKPEPLIEKPSFVIEKQEQKEVVVPQIVQEEKFDVFKNLKSIDHSTADLLYNKGFTSVENLRSATMKQLILQGINKRVARKIKKEIVQLDKKIAKQSKKSKGTQITVSVKTEAVESQSPEWVVTEPSETEKTVPQKQEISVWESVEDIETKEIKKEKVKKVALKHVEKIAKEKEKQLKIEEKRKQKELRKKQKLEAKQQRLTEKQQLNAKKKEQKEIVVPQIVQLDKKIAKQSKKPKRTKITISKKTTTVESQNQEWVVTEPSETQKILPEKQKGTTKQELSVQESIEVTEIKEDKDLKKPKKRKKKDTIVLESVVEETEEWIQKPDRVPSKKTSSNELISTEWEPTPMSEGPFTPEVEQPYQYGDYYLFKKEIETADGKLRTIHFFSKRRSAIGKPASLPEGFEVVINKKTGLPYLKKKAN